MTRDQHDDDIDDDEDDIVQDGQSVRVPIFAMDAVQRAIAFQDTAAANRPGFRYAADDDAEQQAQDAHAEYCEFLRDAHRQRAAVVDEPERVDRQSPVADAERPTSLRDAQQAAEEAYRERSEWLRNAHKG